MKSFDILTCDHFKIQVTDWSDGLVTKILLLFQRTQVVFPAPIVHSSQLPVTQAPGESNAFGFCGAPTYTCTNPYTDAHIYVI